MDEYAQKVSNYVMNKEHHLIHRLPTLGGLGILLLGNYVAQNNYDLGWGIAAIGVVTATVSEGRAFFKMRKLKKDVARIINDKGYEFMKLYANKKNPYEFYQRHILPELQSKQKS
ncbi:hypothetical protein GOV03_00200, partial [Candidatus Woesearchaeota archaeon]|nr:hypothetical protein [Candidatus Woesearchaeota archaeon]